MKVVHELGRELALIGDDGAVMWRYAYGQELAPKPFFHPLAVPNGGDFTAYRPTDHMWHRGLWFTWKFINGANYWEEGQEPQGNQHTLHVPEVKVEEIGRTIAVFSKIEWRDRGQATLREARRIRFTPGNAMHVIDWNARQTAVQDLLIDRTPYTTWGGYGGLVLRAPQSVRHQALLFPDGSTKEYVAGDPHRWCDMTGQMDGGPERYGGVTFLDHPDNPRHPVPIYARTRPLDNFMNMALLFHEPMRLAAGDDLHLRYRVLLHDGKVSAGDLNRAWEEYAREEEG